MTKSFRTGVLALPSLLAAACSDPTFVSLGRNVRQAVTRSDAAVSAPDAGTNGPNVDGVPSDIDLGDEPLCAGETEVIAVSSDCAERLELGCGAADAGTATQALENALSNVLAGCGEIDNVLHVRFSASGCAESFELLYPSTTSGAAKSCIAERLGSARYECAAPGSCGAGVVLHVPID